MKRSPLFILYIFLYIFALLWLWPQWGVASADNPFGERTVKEALEASETTSSQSSPAQPSPSQSSPSRGETGPQPEPSRPAGGIGYALVNMVAALSLVLALIYIFYRLFLRRQRFLREIGGVRYLGGFPLGPQKSLQMVEIAGKVYVLGVAEQVHLLRLIDDPDEKEALLAQIAPPELSDLPSTEITRRFSAKLERLKEQRRKWLDRFLSRQASSRDGEGRP
jgi:flagellar biogenesis protein FliO